MQVFTTGVPALDAFGTVPGIIVIAVLLILFLTRETRNIPGPTRLPIIGNTLEVFRRRVDFLDWLCELHGKHGDTFIIKLLPFMSPFIAVADPENVDFVLKSKFWDFEKGYHFQDKLHEILGYGIFAVDGDLWTVQRKQAAHMFSVNNFRHNMAEVFNRNGNAVVRLLERAADTGSTVDMQDLFFRFTLDSVGEISFGSNIDSLGDATVPFSRAFDNAQAVAEQRFWEPWWKIKRALQLGGERRLRASVKVMDSFSYDIIARRRKEPEEARLARGDLLSRFMSLKDSNGQPLSDQFLRDVIMNFMIAGRDTTANAMSWATYLIATHPEVEARMRDEIAGLPQDPDYDTVRGLAYTKAIVQETLRLYPSVPKDGVAARVSCTLPDGTKVNKGDLVMFMPYVMGRMKKLWGEDCDQFKPDRFLGALEPTSAKFTAFKHGPRTCLGKSMAYLESSCLLSKIFKRFSFKLAPGFEPHYAPSVTLPMRDGLHVTVTRVPNAPIAST